MMLIQISSYIVTESSFFTLRDALHPFGPMDELLLTSYPEEGSDRSFSKIQQAHGFSCVINTS
jgi:hypothetical protein